MYTFTFPVLKIIFPQKFESRPYSLPESNDSLFNILMLSKEHS